MSTAPHEPGDEVPDGPGSAGPEEVDPSQGPGVAREHDQLGDLENPGAAI